jgi:hypothetical protein
VILGFRRDADDMCSSGILCSVEWEYFTDVSGQRIGPIFKGQDVHDYLTFEDGTDTLYRNVGKGLPFDAW